MKKAKLPTIAVVGVGMVGAQVARYFKEKKKYVRGRDLFLFDADPHKKCNDDVSRASIVFIAVPSPSNEDGSANISHVQNALQRIASGGTAVIKSTVPPGTTEHLQKDFPNLKLLFNPEFLTEKSAWEDFLHPDRQIVGSTKKSRLAAQKVLALLPQAPFMSPSKEYKLAATEAELAKYAGNVYLARRVVFANAIADIANNLGVSYTNVREGLATDKRIGRSHLDVDHSGYRGFGGYCFPKDTKALISHCNLLGLRECAELLSADWKFNEQLLSRQGLTLKDVSVHDDKLVRNKKKKK